MMQKFSLLKSPHTKPSPPPLQRAGESPYFTEKTCYSGKNKTLRREYRGQGMGNVYG